MSAVMSRRILADLLERYADQTQFRLPERIDSVRADTSYPTAIRKRLHYLREIADFGAHTQTDGTAEVVNVTEAEAEWTLDVVDALFDYFIVGPTDSRDYAVHYAPFLLFFCYLTSDLRDASVDSHSSISRATLLAIHPRGSTSTDRARVLRATPIALAHSGRARHRSRSWASRFQSTRCSIRSSSVGSAQWMSSTRSSSGARAQADSTAFRTDQKTSLGPVAADRACRARPRRTPPRRSRAAAVRDALAVWQTRPNENRGVASESACLLEIPDFPKPPARARHEPAPPLVHRCVEAAPSVPARCFARRAARAPPLDCGAPEQDARADR